MTRRVKRKLKRACIKIIKVMGDTIDNIDYLSCNNDVSKEVIKLRDSVEDSWREILKLLPSILHELDKKD